MDLAKYLVVFAVYLDLFSRLVLKFKNPAGAPRRALGPPLRPPLDAKGQDTQQKVRDTQPNPRYSAKNNVAIRMIATFMPKYNEIFNCFLCLYAISSVQQILLIIYCLLSQIRYSCIYLNMDKTISNFLQKQQTIFTTRIISEKSLMNANLSIFKC